MAVLQPVKRVRSGLPVKRGRARRSLHFSSERDGNDSRFNLEMAQKLTTISAEECAKKWNFDVNKGVPIPGGRFTWSCVDPKSPGDLTPLDPTSGSAKTGSVTSAAGGVVVEQVTGHSSEVKVAGGQAKELVSTSKEGHKEEREERGGEGEERNGGGGGRKRRREEEEEEEEPSSSSFSSSSSSSSSSSHATLRQTSITDYVRERKRRRKGGSQHSDNTPSNTPTASRKRPAPTPTTTDPHQHPHKKVLLQIRA